MSSLKFIKPDVDLLVKYIEDDLVIWHRGKVTKINPIKKDGKNQAFITIDIRYDYDLDSIYTEILYDNDFNNPIAQEAWTFASKQMEEIVQHIIYNSVEVKALSGTVSKMTSDISYLTERLLAVDKADRKDESNAEVNTEHFVQAIPERPRYSKCGMLLSYLLMSIIIYSIYYYCQTYSVITKNSTNKMTFTQAVLQKYLPNTFDGLF